MDYISQIKPKTVLKFSTSLNTRKAIVVFFIVVIMFFLPINVYEYISLREIESTGQVAGIYTQNFSGDSTVQSETFKNSPGKNLLGLGVFFISFAGIGGMAYVLFASSDTKKK